eukprot:scpid77756/ scgid27692/ 
MMETMLRSTSITLSRMNGTHWSQLKAHLAILMMIVCLVDLCSAAPHHERPEEHLSWNNFLKGTTFATHFIHCLFTAFAAKKRDWRSDGDKWCFALTHIIFWIVGHTTIHNRTDIEQVFEEHYCHGSIRAGYTVVSIVVVLK